MAEGETPKIHIDEDWKKQAQAEKERLAAQAEAREQKSQQGQGGREGQLPEASFRSLVGLLASQALMGLGTMQDSQGKGVMVDLEGAKFNIDLLGVLEEKTKGNLEDEEQKELSQVVSELRNRYVQIQQLVAQQSQQAGAAGVQGDAGAPPQQSEQDESVAGQVGRIITPDAAGSSGQPSSGGSNE